MKLTLTILASLFCIVSKANNDTIIHKITDIEQKIEFIDHKADEIKQNQLNYQIEKDLIKDTFSNNYDKINIFITVGLGIIGLVAFLGIRDISTIKKDYKEELKELQKLKSEFENELKNFKSDKEKFESEIKDINKQNDEQNEKIKILELKDKVSKLIKDNQFTSALEYCSIALDLSPNDATLWNMKGLICGRLGNFEESKKNFKKSLQYEPQNLAIISNYAESLYFTYNIDEAKKIINDHKDYFLKLEKGNLLFLFEVIENYYLMDNDTFMDYILHFMNAQTEFKQKYFTHWKLNDALIFAFNEVNSKKRDILQNTLWFFDGQIDKKTTIERISSK